MKRIYTLIFLFLILSNLCFAQVKIPITGSLKPGSSAIPLSISNLYLWLKADGINATDNDEVTTWKDLSGNNRNAVGNGTTKPIYKQAIVNGSSIVRFNGTNYFSLGDFSALTAGEVFVVLKYAGGGNGFWNFGTSGSVSHYDFSGVIYDTFGTNIRNTVGTASPDTTSNFRLYNVYSANNDWSANYNKVNLFSTSSNAVTFSSSVTLGLSTQGIYWNGDIAEVIFYGRKLTTPERTIVNNYLSQKYNLGI